ncbi:MAG: Uncharacterised protein [Synechococcus sp. CC9902]|nr:MAG: Uncharacterised protein [Synechococcus sp. CC9902]
MLAGFGRGQHPDHPITGAAQAAQIAEKNLMVAKAVGGHQAINQPPGRVWNVQNRVENLAVGG